MTPSITDEQIFTSLRAFLLDILPVGTPVLQGQVNRVAEPGCDDFVVMTKTQRVRLATNTYSNADLDPVTIETAQSTQVNIQLDVHGPLGADNAQVIQTVVRSPYAVEFLAAQDTPVAPLYADDPQQVPFINGEMQYEDRWIMNVALQVTPFISTPQQFADTLTATLIEVDATYPPGG